MCPVTWEIRGLSHGVKPANGVLHQKLIQIPDPFGHLESLLRTRTAETGKKTTPREPGNRFALMATPIKWENLRLGANRDGRRNRFCKNPKGSLRAVIDILKDGEEGFS